MLRRRFEYATKELPNGKIAWRYDLEIRESRRRGGTAAQVDLWPALPKITCPTLLIRGLETDVLAPNVSHKMIQELPQGQLVEVPRAGHMVFEDNPGDTITAMRRFLG